MGIYIQKKLLFGFDKYCENLIKVITQNNIETPISIGIEGEWGQGKTTLLKSIKKELDTNEKYQDRFITIFFEPLRYEEEINFFLALLELLRSKLSIFDYLKSETMKLGTIIGSACMDIILKKGLFFSGGYKEIKNMANDYEKDNLLTTTRSTKISEILNDIIKKISSHSKNLVIFIDDLDRCEPKKIINLLSSINNFLFLEKCIFFIGFNQNLISEILDSELKSMQNYKDVYLDKFMQLTFPIPPIIASEVDQYIDIYYGHLDINSWSRASIAKYVNSTPRSLKLFMNLLSFIISLSDAKYNDEIVKILIIKKNWPEFYERIILNSKNLDNFETNILKTRQHIYEISSTNCPDDIPKFVWNIFNDLIKLDEKGLLEFIIDDYSPKWEKLLIEEREECLKWIGDVPKDTKQPHNNRTSSRFIVSWDGEFIDKSSQKYPVSFIDVSFGGACCIWKSKIIVPENVHEGKLVSKDHKIEEIPVKILRKWSEKNGNFSGFAVKFKLDDFESEKKEKFEGIFSQFEKEKSKYKNKPV